MHWANPPKIAWLYAIVVVTDRIISILFGFNPDARYVGMDIGIIGLTVALLISGSRLVWCLLAGMAIIAMGWTTFLFVLGRLPLDELSFVSMVQITLGYGAIGLIFHSGMRKWIWHESREPIEQV
ncbi:hypothetical protein C0V72_05860 [Porphyrobacter sp. TH134]|uniref:hypothetical protein n=1 Tax=Porphyrobacter sp. TH134 TaxID=2067450 RepID=UPI000C7ACF16|nr:hypothetical protein [Porphyrobacter sp. TH134]PLK24595.1 hypothetical protein C0V72_05860 [Porphyrobacter sp. TH134]